MFLLYSFILSWANESSKPNITHTGFGEDVVLMKNTSDEVSVFLPDAKCDHLGLFCG